MTKKIRLPFAILFSVLLFTACQQSGNFVAGGKIEHSFTEFAGKRIGVGVGTFCGRVTERDLKAIPAYYSEISAGIDDVRRGRIDGYMTDLVVTKMLVSTPGNEDLEYVEVPAELFYAPMGAVSIKPDIIVRFNDFLDDIKADGTLKEMRDRWLEKMPGVDAAMPDIPLAATNGTLKVVTDGTKIPFSYTGVKNELKGYSIELALRFAAREGMGIEFMDVDFGRLIPYVTSGRADLAIANISATEERKRDVLFTDSIYDDQFSIITKK